MHSFYVGIYSYKLQNFSSKTWHFFRFFASQKPSFSSQFSKIFLLLGGGSCPPQTPPGPAALPPPPRAYRPSEHMTGLRPVLQAYGLHYTTQQTQSFFLKNANFSWKKVGRPGFLMKLSELFLSKVHLVIIKKQFCMKIWSYCIVKVVIN